MTLSASITPLQNAPEQQQPGTQKRVCASVATARNSKALRASLNRRLLIAADTMERATEDIPFIQDLYEGHATLAGYRNLLSNLRHQAVDRTPWSTHAATKLGTQQVAISNRLNAHADSKHLDCQMLEADYLACGGQRLQLQQRKNSVHSKRYSAFLLHRATQPDPRDLLGALFIIEGLNQHLAPHWASLLQPVLSLRPEQLVFLNSQKASEDARQAPFDDIFAGLTLTDALVDRIVKTAQTTARLYCSMLAESEPVHC